MTEGSQIYGWTYVSGWAAALESAMLAASFFEQMLDMAEVDDVFYSLTDTPVRDEFGEVEDMLQADARVRGFYDGELERMRAFSPSPQVIDILRMQKEIRSLKSFVKRSSMGLKVPAVASRYGDEVWERLWEGQPTEVPPYFQPVIGTAREALASQPERPEVLDAAFDGACLRALCDAARLIGSSLIVEYYRRYDTAKGVELLWRARAMGLGEEVERMLVADRQDHVLFAAMEQTEPEDWPAAIASATPGLDTERVAAAEGLGRIRAFTGAGEEWLMAFARDARFVAFGPERVFGCAVGLMAEADNLVLAVAGRANGIAPDVLRPRLRTCYV
jgi:V/A-type H+-transporting ATPase subunit C